MTAKQIAQTSTDFESFRRENRRKVNYALNRVLQICVLAGPAIALGILGGVFRQTTYAACVIISCVSAAVALGNRLILQKHPYSYVPGMIALGAVEVLLCYMNASHVSIRLTWFLVPLLSLLFCDSRVYIGTSIVSYLITALGIWLEAGHYAEIRTDFATPLAGFINIFAGCTIEAVIMFAAGFALSRETNNYYRRMINQYAEQQRQKEKLQQQLDILESMAEIYDYVNLIDFTEHTEMSLRSEPLRKLTIAEGQDHTNMTQGLRSSIAPDMLDAFWRFTDITTVPARLVGHRSIDGEFIHNATGWFRAQYIRVGGALDRAPEVVIYTIRNIDADKRREEHLIRIARTDELTRVFNRRCYEEDIAEMRLHGMSDDLAIISADVNGLKRVNDTLGHTAGDELLRGAAFCLLTAVGSGGNVYRTGGDEFMIIARTADCEAMLRAIRRAADEWRGAIVDGVSISAGCASHAERPDAGVEDLEKLADARMYEEKQRYYRRSGQDAR